MKKWNMCIDARHSSIGDGDRLGDEARPRGTPALATSSGGIGLGDEARPRGTPALATSSGGVGHGDEARPRGAPASVTASGGDEARPRGVLCCDPNSLHKKRPSLYTF